MNDVLLNVFVPALNKDYDIVADKDEKIYVVLELIKKAVEILSEGLFLSNSQSVICDRLNGKILNINKSAKELGLKDGSKLMLI